MLGDGAGLRLGSLMVIGSVVMMMMKVSVSVSDQTPLMDGVEVSRELRRLYEC